MASKTLQHSLKQWPCDKCGSLQAHYIESLHIEEGNAKATPGALCCKCLNCKSFCAGIRFHSIHVDCNGYVRVEVPRYSLGVAMGQFTYADRKVGFSVQRVAQNYNSTAGIPAMTSIAMSGYAGGLNSAASLTIGSSTGADNNSLQSLQEAVELLAERLHILEVSLCDDCKNNELCREHEELRARINALTKGTEK